jgi:hypothetical protein
MVFYNPTFFTLLFVNRESASFTGEVPVLLLFIDTSRLADIRAFALGQIIAQIAATVPIPTDERYQTVNLYIYN